MEIPNSGTVDYVINNQLEIGLDWIGWMDWIEITRFDFN